MRDLRFSQWCCTRYNCSGISCCLVGQKLPDVSKGCVSFLFRVKRAEMRSNFSFDHQTLTMETFNDPSKRKELFTQRHNITSYNTQTFILLSSAGYYLNNHTFGVAGLLYVTLLWQLICDQLSDCKLSQIMQLHSVRDT